MYTCELPWLYAVQITKFNKIVHAHFKFTIVFKLSFHPLDCLKRIFFFEACTYTHCTIQKAHMTNGQVS